jgi:hypothetical protein
VEAQIKAKPLKRKPECVKKTGFMGVFSLNIPKRPLPLDSGGIPCLNWKLTPCFRANRAKSLWISLFTAPLLPVADRFGRKFPVYPPRFGQI